MENGYTGVSNNDAATLALLGGGYGGLGGSFRSGFDTDGSVIASKIEGNKDLFSAINDRIIDSQSAQFERLADLQQGIARDNAEFRTSDRAFATERVAAERSASLDRLLFNQFNQIDRRFSDAALKQQECCCKLEAGQASILAKLDAQEQVRNAMVQAEQGAKLDALLSRRGGGQGNG